MWLLLLLATSLSGCNGAPAVRPPVALEPREEPPRSGPDAAAAVPAPTPAAAPDAGPARPDPWARFLAAAQGGGVVRVAHFGDSHTAAEALTSRLRRLLQARIGDAGHGFVVPGWDASRLHRGVDLRASRGWRVDRVRYLPDLDPGDRLFGIGAASIRSRARGESFSVSATASVLDLYFLGQPGGGLFHVSVDGGDPARVATASEQRGVLFHRIEVPDGPHRLDVEALGDGEVRIFGVQIERPGPGIVYSSLGVGGARMTTPLEWDEALFAGQLARMRPDLVVMMYGTNDLYAADFTVEGFVGAFERLIGRIRGSAPGVSCLVLAPPDVARTDDSGRLASVPALPALVAAERVAALRSGCAFWDTLAKMGGPGSILDWLHRRPPLAGRDHIHLTPRGYERLAEPIAAEILSRL